MVSNTFLKIKPSSSKQRAEAMDTPLLGISHAASSFCVTQFKANKDKELLWHVRVLVECF